MGYKWSINIDLGENLLHRVSSLAVNSYCSTAGQFNFFASARYFIEQRIQVMKLTYVM
jgi:hypothetical protein